MSRQPSKVGVISDNYDALRFKLQALLKEPELPEYIPKALYGGGRIPWANFAIVQPDDSVAAITRDAARNSATALHQFLQQFRPLARKYPCLWQMVVALSPWRNGIRR
ncbi:hypothetical protein CYMTET_26213 [Cymbomonas tetramitiformis]|uniref:Uncharacterized protein n=1 Tax=Cymbomonas tetramitiformis TaxID=36881 RepID=A0AAE0KYE8_9CHLO|nr:hypothetical protein CYMTET_26213 [Cymbomonas tetramitiformis]